MAEIYHNRNSLCFTAPDPKISNHVIIGLESAEEISSESIDSSSLLKPKKLYREFKMGLRVHLTVNRKRNSCIQDTCKRQNNLCSYHGILAEEASPSSNSK